MASIANDMPAVVSSQRIMALKLIAYWLTVYLLFISDPTILYLLFISLFINFARPTVGVLALIGCATIFVVLATVLPPWLVRLPESVIPPTATWLDAAFNFLREDLGLTKLTRFFSDRLEFQLKVTAHLLYGARVYFFNPVEWVWFISVAFAFIYFVDGRRPAEITGAALCVVALVFTFLIGEGKPLGEGTQAWAAIVLLICGLIASGAVLWRYRWIAPLLVFGVTALCALILNGYKLGPLPWTAVAAAAAVVGYYLGGWRIALLAGGTLFWTALIGQWKLAMQTMSVVAVAAPVAFLIGIFLGISAWKFDWFDRAIKPVLSVLQTLPFFTYLLPAVIFFKVGPAAGGAATIVFAIPPMVLMTTLGLKKVSPEIVEAGKMSGCTRWQMLSRVYLPAARTEILVGVNQVIMLCLAMVVLTAFIGMPGLGAKLLAMMNSFKLGRSFEIGVTIVLLAIMLDRLSRAWVVKQREHFERGTPWWRQHIYLVGAIGAFIGFILIAQAVQVADHISRSQDFSKGKEIDAAMKSFLAIDSVQAVTGWLRWFLITQVLIPFRNFLISIPTYGFIMLIVAFALWLGGKKSAIVAAVFFTIVALSGWWDRSVITLYTVISAVALAMLIGLPLAVWSARGAAQSLSVRNGLGELAVGLIGLFFRRIPIFLGALLVAWLYDFFNAAAQIAGEEAAAGEAAGFLSLSSPPLYVFALTFVLLWLAVRRWPRDKVMLVIVDSAQTFPSFIYLLPAIMLFGINDVAVIFSILIFTLVPLVRYTIEGLRAVPVEMTEAADMAGATRLQKLMSVQLPLALPTMAVGFNQAIMFAFFMVIIAAFIGTQDLGQELQRTLAGTDLGKNFVLGINVSLMALVFDQMIMRWSGNRRRALGLD